MRLHGLGQGHSRLWASVDIIQVQSIDTLLILANSPQLLNVHRAPFHSGICADFDLRGHLHARLHLVGAYAVAVLRPGVPQTGSRP